MRPILLGLLYLLMVGGGQVAIAVAPAPSEAIAGGVLASPDSDNALEAIVLEERLSYARQEGRMAEPIAGTAWLDPYVPPVLAASRSNSLLARPVAGGAGHFLAFARAPPFCS